MASGTPKLIFANQLRGLAAIFVAGSHLGGAFWVMRDFVSLASATPVQGGTPSPMLDVFTLNWLNFGPFGVGVFFLISGLVIPISLEQHTRGSFMFARVLRIYPTYVAALLIEMAVLHADAGYWGTTFPYGHWTIISNALLIYNSVGQPSVDLVNWTLCIELKFYLLMMVLAPQVRRGSLSSILVVGATITTVNTLLAWYPLAETSSLNELAQQFSIESTFIIFMLIGVLFNFRLRGLLRLPAFAASSAGMLVFFVTSWLHSAIAGQAPAVTVNYLYAVVLFGGMFFLRRHARPLRLLDFLASISFPFYLIHSMLGFAILKLMMLRYGFGYFAAVFIASSVILCVATVLHYVIEIRSIAIGKLLARRPARREDRTYEHSDPNPRLGRTMRT